MKIANLRMGFLIAIVVMTISFCTFTPTLSNLFGILIEPAYIIPDESSVFTFTVTQMNDGSGDWWLYSEDSENFYTKMMYQDNTSYSVISRIEAEQIDGFDKMNFRTW